MEIVPGVHLIPSSFVNLYLIVDPDGLTLIDAGTARSEKGIRQYIASTGHSLTDLRRIVITHADTDHIGSLAALKAGSGARVYASPIEAQAIAAGRSSRAINVGGPLKGLLNAASGLLMGTKPVTVDELLAAGQVLPVLGGLRVVATPGHTPGHVSLYAPAAGILFAGDSMVSADGRLHPSRKMLSWDVMQALASVRVQAALGAQIVCVGHGPVIRDAANKFPQV
jgi:glyoxylase-like metal-dependent hydrolase (beta-lactamase superfamily II)